MRREERKSHPKGEEELWRVEDDGVDTCKRERGLVRGSKVASDRAGTPVCDQTKRAVKAAVRHPAQCIMMLGATGMQVRPGLTSPLLEEGAACCADQLRPAPFKAHVSCVERENMSQAWRALPAWQAQQKAALMPGRLAAPA